MAESTTLAPPPPAAVTSVTPATPAPSSPLTPRPARNRMFQALQTKADTSAIAPASDPKPPTPAPAPEPSPDPEQPDPEVRPGAPEEEPAPAEAPAAPEAPKPAEGKDKPKEKVNPWKLVEQYKAKVAAKEKELADAHTNGLAEQQRKEYADKLQKAEARLKEYDDEMRFVNYKETQEFKEKWEKPWNAAWNRSTGDLAGLTVPTEDGGSRPFTANDMLELVSMDTIPARRRANELYGDLANEVMIHRNEIKRTNDEMNAALEDAKKNGAERVKQQQEQFTKSQQEVSDQVAKSFKAAYDDAIKDETNGVFFQPREGDDEWNEALEHGKKLSASVFTEDPRDPKLSPTERSAIAKRHAAVFNRSAAFGPLKRDFLKLKKQYAAMEKELAGYKGSKPDAGTQRAPAGQTNGAPARARDRMSSSLEEFARTHGR